MMDSTQLKDETMPIMDDQEGIAFSTDSNELLMGDEKQWGSPLLETRRRMKRHRFTKAFGPYRWLIDAFLLFIIAGLLLLLRGQSKASPSNSWQIGGDSTGAGPKSMSAEMLVGGRAGC